MAPRIPSAAALEMDREADEAEMSARSLRTGCRRLRRAEAGTRNARIRRLLRAVLVAMVRIALASPAAAQWTRVQEPVPPAAPPSLRFTVLGAHPIGDEARFRVELPEAGRVRIDFFDTGGRRVADGIDSVMPAGVNEVRWQAGRLPAGVYTARLRAAGRSESVMLVRLR